MPVYHFTVHAYRSWSPSHPRGFVQRHTGILPTDERMARDYERRARFARVWFDSVAIQQVLVLGCIDVCRRRGWRLHVVATDRTHLHWVVSWRDYLPCEVARAKTKNILSLLLGRLTGETGRRWFVREGSRKRVVDRAHLARLTDTYLPDHRGLCWREGDPIPADTHDVLSAKRDDADDADDDGQAPAVP